MASVWYLYTTLADIRVSLPDEQLIVYILHKNETLSGNTWNTCPALGWQQCNYDSIKLPNKKQLHCPEYCFLINAGSLSYNRFICHDEGALSPKHRISLQIESIACQAWGLSSRFWTSLCFIPSRSKGTKSTTKMLCTTAHVLADETAVCAVHWPCTFTLLGFRPLC